MTIPSEAVLVRALSRYLIEKGFEVRSEVPNMGQAIDLVATKNGHITAIEVKRMDWVRALEQCRAHVVVADFIVIAIGLKSIPPKLSKSLHSRGWGLMMYDSIKDSWRPLSPPRKNQQVWGSQREVFVKNLMQIKPDESC